MLSKSLIPFSVYGWGCVTFLLFVLKPNYVEVMKIMVTSFKSSHACSAIFHARSPAAGHRRPTPLLETPGHSWASLGQSFEGSLLLSPASSCTQGSVCTLQESVTSVLCKFWPLYGVVNMTSSKKSYALPRSAAPRASAPATVHCWPIPPQEAGRHSSGSGSVGSLGPGVHKASLSPLSFSGRYGVWF